MVQALGAISFCGLLPFAVIRFVRGDIVIVATEVSSVVQARIKTTGSLFR